MSIVRVFTAFFEEVAYTVNEEMIEMQKATCPNCGQKFNYQEVRNVVEHAKVSGIITCPYCHTEIKAKMTHGYFISYKINSMPVAEK